MAIYLSDSEPRATDPPVDDAETSPRRRDPEATRRSILDAAEDLFVCHGPAATSMSQVAKKAQVTKSLIHHHFGSKDELWGEVQARHFEQYHQAQKELMATTDGTAELLEQSLIAFFRHLQVDSKSVRFMSWAFCEDEGSQCATLDEKELFELGIERIRQAQERGEIRDDLEPFFIIKSLIALPMAWFQSKALTMSMVDGEVSSSELDEKYLRDVVKLFMDGVRAPASQS